MTLWVQLPLCVRFNAFIYSINYTGYSATGRKYGVSDNTIIKWKKVYDNLMER